jgi:hypothetical protein
MFDPCLIDFLHNIPYLQIVPANIIKRNHLDNTLHHAIQH